MSWYSTTTSSSPDTVPKLSFASKHNIPRPPLLASREHTPPLTTVPYSVPYVLTYDKLNSGRSVFYPGLVEQSLRLHTKAIDEASREPIPSCFFFTVKSVVVEDGLLGVTHVCMYIPCYLSIIG